MRIRSFPHLLALATIAGVVLVATSQTHAEPQGAHKATKPVGAKSHQPAQPAPATADQGEAAKTLPPTAEDAERRAQVLARFDDGQVTVGELEDAITGQNPYLRKRFQDPKEVQALLDKTLRFELLAQEAARRGYDKNQVVAFSVKQNAVQTMIKKEFDEKITAESIPAEDVKKYYDEHIDEFVRTEMRRASQVLLPNEADAKALLTDAKAADMRAFRELARNKSTDEASKLRGGDLGYFDLKGKVMDAPNESVHAAIVKAAFALKNVGDTSEPVKVGDGVAIVKLTGQRPAHEETLKDASERIRMRLWRERRQTGIDDLLAALKKQYQPEVHPELLDAIKFDTGAPVAPTEGLPPGFPQAKPQAAAPSK